MTSRTARSESRPFDGVAAELVVAHIRSLIDQGQLKPGDRLPAERELAVHIGVSRPSVRAGLRALAAMGVVQSRHGAGTFIRSGPPVLGSEPLSFLAALHGFTRDEMFEARRVLEVGVAGLAAERATGEHLATAAEEITGMYASLDEPLAFLRHDIRFHRAIAAASGNPILASLVEMVSALFYETRRKTAGRAHDLRESAEMHRAIYNALRVRDADRSRQAMNDHLVLAQQRQHLEDAAATPNGEAVANGSNGDVPGSDRPVDTGRAQSFARDLLTGDLAHQGAPVRARGIAMGTRRTPVSRVRAGGI
jgi:GntR family transcriptional regulator, transcriptional repressor for pyruvate dehydrogenase complex